MNFSIGGFVPRGEDGRPNDDVLVNNRDFLAFDIKDFNGAMYGAEWLTGLGNNFDAGFGVGFYSRTVPTVYPDFVNSRWHRDRAGDEAARRAVHGDSPLAAAGACPTALSRTSAAASAC